LSEDNKVCDDKSKKEIIFQTLDFEAFFR